MQLKTGLNEGLKFRIKTQQDLEKAFLVLKSRLSAESSILTFQQEKEKRRTLQNRRYWKLLHDISDCLGYDADTWHEYFKRKFIGVREFRLPDGEVVNLGMSSTDLCVSDFSDYMLCVEAWGADRGVIFSDEI